MSERDDLDARVAAVEEQIERWMRRIRGEGRRANAAEKRQWQAWVDQLAEIKRRIADGEADA